MRPDLVVERQADRDLLGEIGGGLDLTLVEVLASEGGVGAFNQAASVRRVVRRRGAGRRRRWPQGVVPLRLCADPRCRRSADETSHHGPTRLMTAQHRRPPETWIVQHNRLRATTVHHAFGRFPRPVHRRSTLGGPVAGRKCDRWLSRRAPARMGRWVVGRGTTNGSWGGATSRSRRRRSCWPPSTTTRRPWRWLRCPRPEDHTDVGGRTPHIGT